MVETETGAVGAVEAKAQAEREGGAQGLLRDEEGHSGGRGCGSGGGGLGVRM